MRQRTSPRHKVLAAVVAGVLALGVPAGPWAGESASGRGGNATPAAHAGEARPGERHAGVASYYGGRFHGRRTASGEVFDERALTAAHRTLPLGTRVRVVSRETGRAVVVRVNDRGPYVRGRTIDLSRRAGEILGLREAGVAPVVIEVVAPPGA